jgi:hypothetical protein
MLSRFPGLSAPSVHEKHGKYAFRRLLVKDNCRKKSGHALKEITMLERAKEVTRDGKYVNLEYARFADDVVILINAHPQNDRLLKAVDQRVREEFAKL